MELSHIISVLIFLVIVTVPIIMLVRSGNKKKKVLNDKVNQLKNQYRLNISERDTWDDIMICLDKNAQKILWVKESEEGLVVDLDEIAQCKKFNVSRMVKAGKESSQVLDRLGLELIGKDSQATPVTLEFYNSGNSYLFNFQLELQSKWQKLISESLRA
ncbi:MAG: hypothetical protein GC192_12885 [Bacteroidetes bacterium]|nr:hypothetical protein [Bacteroidota bacterium]